MAENLDSGPQEEEAKRPDENEANEDGHLSDTGSGGGGSSSTPLGIESDSDQRAATCSSAEDLSVELARANSSPSSGHSDTNAGTEQNSSPSNGANNSSSRLTYSDDDDPAALHPFVDPQSRVAQRDMQLRRMGRCSLLASVGPPKWAKAVAPGTAYVERVQVKTNLYPIKIKVREVFCYNITIRALPRSKASSKSEITLSRADGNDVRAAERAVVNKRLLQLFRDDLAIPDQPGHMIYNGYARIFSLTPLTKASPDVVLSRRFTVADLQTIDPESAQRLRQFEHIHVVISENENYRVDLENALVNTANHMLATEFIGMVAKEPAVQSDRYFAFPAEFYLGTTLSNYTSLGEGKRLHPGMAITARVIEDGFVRDKEKKSMICLQLSSGKGPFHEEMTVYDRLKEAFPNQRAPWSSITDLIQQQLLRLAVTTTHRARIGRPETVFEIKSLGPLTKDVFFERDVRLTGGTSVKEKTSLVDYFRTTYKIDLRAEPLFDAPTVVDRKGSIFPLDILKIVPGQRVRKDLVTPHLQSALTKACSMSPVERNELVNMVMSDLKVAEHDAVTAVMDINPQSISDRCRVLQTPALRYNGGDFLFGKSQKGVGRFSARPGLRKFAKAGKTIEKWAAYLIPASNASSYERVGYEEFKKFVDQFTQECNSRGFTVANCMHLGLISSSSDEDALNRLEKELTVATEADCQFILLATTDQYTRLHPFMKLFELATGVVVQDVKIKTVSSVVTQGRRETLENITMKTNLKFGGYNYRVAYGPAIVHDKTTISIGVSLNPGSERAGLGEMPTIVGFAANVTGESGQIVGDWSFERAAGQQIVEAIDEIIERVVVAYQSPSDQRAAPERVIIYRQGAPDGEINNLWKFEARLARAKLNHCGFSKVPLIYILVQRAHSCRFWKADAKPNEPAPLQNVPVGTVIDTNVVTPGFKEFYINSHVALQGAAKSPRYAVLVDECNMSADRLQQLIHAECANFQIINAMVSIPAPLYIAQRYAERGANNARFYLQHFQTKEMCNKWVAQSSMSPEERHNERTVVGSLRDSKTKTLFRPIPTAQHSNDLAEWYNDELTQHGAEERRKSNWPKNEFDKRNQPWYTRRVNA